VSELFKSALQAYKKDAYTKITGLRLVSGQALQPRTARVADLFKTKRGDTVRVLVEHEQQPPRMYGPDPELPFGSPLALASLDAKTKELGKRSEWDLRTSWKPGYTVHNGDVILWFTKDEYVARYVPEGYWTITQPDGTIPL
jgi:hypothetical protein